MADEVNYHHHETKVDEPCDAAVAAPAPAAPKAENYAAAPAETTDRGLFNFFGKKKEEEAVVAPAECEEKVEVYEEPKVEEKKHESLLEKLHHHETKVDEPCEDAVIAAEFEEKVQVCEEPKPEEKHESLLEKLHRSDSSSSSSSEEEVEENGEKIKRKKKKGLKEKIFGEKKEEEVKCEDVIKVESTAVPLERYDDVPTSYEPEEKKGFLEKIKEKLPGGKKPEEVAVAPPVVAEECGATTPEGYEGKEKKGFLEKIKEKIPGYHPKTEEEKEKKEKVEDC